MNNFLKNVFYAFGSQFVSLLSSLAVTFIIPSLIGVEKFAYWQLFLTYVTYVNISRLGLMDGMYLRLGGKKYQELNYSLLSCERGIFVGFQAVVASVLLIAISCLNLEGDRKFVFIACCICIVVINANNYLSYILQAVNLTRIYSMSVIIQNIAWFIAVLVILIFRFYSYKVIIILYICGHICAGIYLSYNTREIKLFKKYNISDTLRDIQENIKCGIKLMIALYAGNLVVSSTKMIVDAAWGVMVFGYFSFALTLANVFLTFISQVSIVVFPALRRVGSEKQLDAYYLLRNFLSLILPIVMLGYFPITIIVHYILPQYEQSLLYVPIFLPYCTFDGKMQLMCSSFFKTLRKESTLLTINIFTLGCSVAIAFVGSYFIRSVEFVAYGLLFTIAIRSVVSEIVLSKMLKVSITRELIQEIILVVLFIVISRYTTAAVSFIVYGGLYLVYLLVNNKRIKKIYCLCKRFK